MSEKDPFIYAHRHSSEIVWMSQNTNQIPTSPEIERTVVECIKRKEYNLYPYAKGIEGLRESVLSDLNLDGREYDVLITNGGIEGLYIANRGILENRDEVIATDPSFLPIHHQITLSQAEVVEIPVYRHPWKLAVEDVEDSITERTKAILLIDPLNPLGTSYRKDEVKELCEIAEEKNIYVLDDITYRDFADEHVLTSEFYPERTIIIYSFSKNCGFAGMRIGALIAKRELMEKLEKYNTNVLSANIIAQRAALAALETKKEWIGRVVTTCRKNQSIIKNAVESIEDVCLPVYPSYTNMFVIDISGTGVRPDAVQDRLLYEHGIFVRSGNYVSKRFGDRFIRVSFSVSEEGVNRFADVLPVVMDELRD